MKSNIEKRVLNIVKEETMHLDMDSFNKHETFESIGLDSLDKVEILMHIEDEFEIEIYDDISDSFKSPEDIIKYISKL